MWTTILCGSPEDLISRKVQREQEQEQMDELGIEDYEEYLEYMADLEEDRMLSQYGL